MSGHDQSGVSADAEPKNRITDGAALAQLAEDRAKALAHVSLSPEVVARLDRYVALLLSWQQHTNLIAPSTEPIIWTRHIADSLQLLALAPHAKIWVDLGSGAGFPGLVIACALVTPGSVVHLVESIGKKATFLRDAVRATGAPAQVHGMRIEEFAKNPPAAIDVVTARALAPLQRLLGLAYPLLKTGALGLFLKGQDFEAELTETAKCWKVNYSLTPSLTDPKAQIVVVHHAEPKPHSPTRS
jgi:16S rRNA (guanine527-N7)-methyltransferase